MPVHSKTADATTLLASPPYQRLKAHLQDLIIVACERCTIPGAQLHLARLQYVSDEKHADKFSMHFAALVKEAGHVGGIPLQVTFTVRTSSQEFDE